MGSGEENKSTAIDRRKLDLAGYVRMGMAAVYSTIYRFPLAVLMFAVLAGILIYRIETPYLELQKIEEVLNRVMFLLALGIPFSLSVDLLLERLQKNAKAAVRLSWYAAELVLLALYYVFLLSGLDMESAVRVILLTLTMTLGFLFIPYLPRKRNFEVYITKLLTRAVITAFYTITLAIGIMATLLAVKSLLYSNLNTNYYLYTWILAWLVFAPLHFLYAVPHVGQGFAVEEYNKVLKILLLYIVLPVITVYTIVLYLYFGKILLTWEWPTGIVSYLVLSYAAAGIAALFLISPFRHENKWARLFCMVFPKLILPLLAMMFASISIRIEQFGFTENRYFVVAIGIWAAGVMLFYNFNKGRNNIVLPVALAAIMVLSAFGPWSAFNVSEASQAERFYNIMEKYNMIEDGEIVNNDSEITAEDRREIVAILRYFDRSHELSDLKYLPKDFSFADMKAVFGFTEAEVYMLLKEDSFSYYSEEGLPVVITGYDLLFPIDGLRVGDTDEMLLEREMLTEYGVLRVTLNDGYQLLLQRDQEVIYTFDLQRFVSSIYVRYGGDARLEPEGLTLTGENDSVKVKIVFSSLSGYLGVDGNDFSINHIRANLLVKLK